MGVLAFLSIFFFGLYVIQCYEIRALKKIIKNSIEIIESLKAELKQLNK